MASNNPFADLLSSSDATPDSVASDDLIGDVSGHNNPFLSALKESNDVVDDDENVAAAAAAVTYDDPWSSCSPAGWYI